MEGLLTIDADFIIGVKLHVFGQTVLGRLGDGSW